MNRQHTKTILIFTTTLMIMCGIAEISLLIIGKENSAFIPLLIMLVIYGGSRFVLELYEIKGDQNEKERNYKNDK